MRVVIRIEASGLAPEIKSKQKPSKDEHVFVRSSTRSQPGIEEPKCWSTTD